MFINGLLFGIFFVTIGLINCYLEYKPTPFYHQYLLQIPRVIRLITTTIFLVMIIVGIWVIYLSI
jgi:hypothetical protein